MSSHQFEPIDSGSLENLFKRQFDAGGIIRDLPEWRKYVPKAQEALIRRAQTISFDKLPIEYSALGGKIGLYSQTYFHLKIAAILWACSEFEHSKGRPLITSIAVNKETMQPGKGFWSVSGIPAKLGKPMSWKDDMTVGERMDFDREVFWIEEIRRVSEYWLSRSERHG